MGVRVRQRKGSWWVFVNYRGRRQARRIGTRQAAQAFAEKLEVRLAMGEAGLVPKPAALTLRAYAERWLAGHGRLRVKASSLDHYRYTLERYWYPTIGAIPITALTRERIRDVVAALAVRLRAVTIRQGILVALQACLSAAVEDGVLAVSPAARLGRLVRPDAIPTARVDPYTREELVDLLARAEAELPESYPVFLTLARTGLRIGELMALQPDDLDFRERALWVRRALYRGQVSTPKSGKGRRVDMSRQLVRVLEGWLALRAAEEAVNGRPAPVWLFPGPNGPCQRHYIADRWRALQRRAAVRYRTLHQLRHTFASLLLQQGESLPYVRDQLGHSSIRLTVDTYGHLVPGANRQAVDRLDDATGRNPGATAHKAELGNILSDAKIADGVNILQ